MESVFSIAYIYNKIFIFPTIFFYFSLFSFTNGFTTEKRGFIPIRALIFFLRSETSNNRHF